MLSIRDLRVNIRGREILRGVDFQIPDGEVHALFGPNGSGKSVMMMSIMGYPEYEVKRGSIIFNGRDVTRMPIDERAKLGIGISEQRPPVIKDVRLRDLVSLIRNEKHFIPDYRAGSGIIDIERFLDRGINDGLSGGESKQSELFLLLLSNPMLLLLDEPDSGVDPAHLKLLGKMINSSLRDVQKKSGPRNRAYSHGTRKAGLISTHSAAILEYIKVEKAHLLMDGKIKCSGDPLVMMDHIRGQGYNHCINCLAPTRTKLRHGGRKSCFYRIGARRNLCE